VLEPLGSVAGPALAIWGFATDHTASNPISDDSPFERVALAPQKSHLSPTNNATTGLGVPRHDISMETTSGALAGAPTVTDGLGETGEDPHAHAVHSAGKNVPHTTARRPEKVIVKFDRGPVRRR
jgi:hypothetical protein